MATKIYAAYGSNMNLKQMAARCPAAKVIGTGYISGHRLTFRGGGVANIEKARGRKVPVVLWEITPRCEIALDQYEGFPRLYIKRKVKVKAAEGEISAFVYVMAAQYETMPNPPGQYYLEVIWRGYKENKMPLNYLREAVAENQRECDEKPPKVGFYMRLSRKETPGEE